MRRFTLIAILALIAAVAPARAIPPEAAGAQASSNVELVANFPELAAIGGKIIGTTLYTTTPEGVRIFDVSLGIPVPIGALEIPHFENEDVDTNGKILLIGADHALSLANTVYVVDVSIPHVPILLAAKRVGSRAHTISCIDSTPGANDCRYGWLAGNTGSIGVVDLADPAAPVDLGRFTVAGFTHDVQVDAEGIAWVVSSAGLFGFKPNVNAPLAPQLVVSQATSSNENPNPRFNSNFILHNSLRPQASLTDPAKLGDANVDPGELVLVTEEDYDSPCTADGQFQTGWYRKNAQGQLVVERLDGFRVGAEDVTKKPGTLIAANCSSHYFSFDGNIVADAWYEQGVRFLDVSNPRDIREIGYWLPAVTQAWSTLWHTVGNERFVYVFDVARGLDVLRFTGAPGDAAVSPVFEPRPALSRPSDDFGWACRVLGA